MEYWRSGGSLGGARDLTRQTPRASGKNKKLLEDFQALLREQGFELEWPRIHAV